MQEQDKPLAILVDFSGIMRRQYHALKQRGEDQLPSPTSFMLNPCVSTLRNEIKTVEKIKGRSADYLLVAFDHPGKTFRHHFFDDYKKDREQPPLDYSSQANRLYDLLEGMNICCARIPFVESDDVICSAVSKFDALGVQCTILTRDKDCFALISKNTDIYSGADKKLYTLENMHEKIPVTPDKVSSYLAAVGDNADGIPGIPRLGKTYAEVIFKQYTIKELIERPEIVVELNVRGGQSIMNWIQENKHLINTYHKLATLSNQVTLGLTLAQMKHYPHYYTIN